MQTYNNDVLISKYFIPSQLKHIEITEEDSKKFVEWSSNGKHKEDLKKSHFNDGFNALVSGKKRANLHIDLWEQGILEGSYSYYTILMEGETLPEYIISFIKKTMFKGQDRGLIEKLISEYADTI